MTEEGLIAENLFYCRDAKALIQNVTHAFLPGALYGVIGPNGAGKSTFLRLLAGICPPTAGTVYWRKEPLHKKIRPEISKIISLVPQNHSTCFDYKVSDLVAMGRYAHNRRRLRKIDRDMIEKMLREVDVWHLRDHLVPCLSSGERQRAYLARSLAAESPVLLLDEPTSALDLRHQLEIWQLLQELARQGKTIVVALHDLDAAMRYCDRLLVFKKGICVTAEAAERALSTEILKDVFGVIPTSCGYTRS